jgi:hypothetical protein
MKFRFKAFALHLLVSASALTLILGSLYLGWYRWPGWYLAGVASVVAVLVGVDLALGPLMTFVVAKATKPRSELKRDIAIIGGDDVTAMPRYFKPWTEGLPELRGQLKQVDSVLYFSKPEKQALAQSMRARGLDSNQNNTISLSGRGKPLLAVFDPKTLNIVALLAAPALPPYRPHQQKLVARSAASSH